LQQADIERAVGLVAGTDNDADNLSIIMTALDLNRELFVVARMNHLDNGELFERVGAQVVMHPSQVIAHRIHVRLGLPLLSEFVTYARFQDDAWSCELVSRIAALVSDSVPHVWQVTIDPQEARAVCESESLGLRVTLDDLLRDPGNRDRRLAAIPLLLEHKDARSVLPPPDQRLRPGDRLLLCGLESSRRRMQWSLQDPNRLRYVATGVDAPEGWFWRWAERWRVANRRPGGGRG
jgi:hypothetical protein